MATRRNIFRKPERSSRRMVGTWSQLRGQPQAARKWWLSMVKHRNASSFTCIQAWMHCLPGETIPNTQKCVELAKNMLSTALSLSRVKSAIGLDKASTRPVGITALEMSACGTHAPFKRAGSHVRLQRNIHRCGIPAGPEIEIPSGDHGRFVAKAGYSPRGAVSGQRLRLVTLEGYAQSPRQRREQPNGRHIGQLDAIRVIIQRHRNRIAEL